MSKYFLYLIIFCALQACSSKQYLQTYWNNDLQQKEFREISSICYHDLEQISLKVFNNDKYLDLFVETNSPLTLNKIYNLGLSVWLDPKGNERNIFGINFPTPGYDRYSKKEFKSYLTRFSREQFQEELMDRFQEYEIIDTKNDETITSSTLIEGENYKLKLRTSPQILFSYHLRIPMYKLYTDNLPKDKISIIISSIYDSEEQYNSALSSKEYINKRLNKLKAGFAIDTKELNEWVVTLKLANKN